MQKQVHSTQFGAIVLVPESWNLLCTHKYGSILFIYRLARSPYFISAHSVSLFPSLHCMCVRVWFWSLCVFCCCCSSRLCEPRIYTWIYAGYKMLVAALCAHLFWKRWKEVVVALAHNASTYICNAFSISLSLSGLWRVRWNGANTQNLVKCERYRVVEFIFGFSHVCVRAYMADTANVCFYMCTMYTRCNEMILAHTFYDFTFY